MDGLDGEVFESPEVQGFDPTTGYVTVVETALSIARSALDGAPGDSGFGGGTTIDAATRDAARAFLRAEFARWSALYLETSLGGES